LWGVSSAAPRLHFPATEQADDGDDGDDEDKDGVSAKCFQYGRRGCGYESFLQEQQEILQLLQDFIFLIRNRLMMAAMVRMRIRIAFLQKAFNMEDAAARTKAFCRNRKSFFSCSKTSFSCCR
jgi:hypothetical protein